MPFMGGSVGGALTLRTAITLANKQFLAAMEAVDAKTGAVAGAMKRHSRTFAIGAMIITAALAGSVKAAAAFEQSMANMDSVAGATRAEFAQLEAQAISLGTTTVYNATQVADAMYWLASAGQRAAEISSTLPGVLTLAAATGHDLAETTETVVSVLSAFQYEAAQTDRVVNSMAATIGSSLANMDKLTEAMKYAAPVAKAAGQEIEDLNAMLGLFFNAGLQGSQAGTSYRRAMLGLLKPSDDFKKILGTMDMTAADVNPKMNDMADIVDRLRDNFFDATDVVEAFGLRGATSMLYLMEVGGDALREMEEGVTNTTAAQDMMRRQMDTLQSQLTIMKNAFHGAAIKLGTALLPALRRGAAWTLRLATALARISTPMATATAKSMAMGGALLGLLSIVGRLAPLLGAATGPIGLIATAVIGLGIAHTIAKGKLEKYIEELDNATDAEAENLESKIRWSLGWSVATNWRTWVAMLASMGDSTKAVTAVAVIATDTLIDAMGYGADAAANIVDTLAAEIKAAREEADREIKLMTDKLELAERLAEEGQRLKDEADARAAEREATALRRSSVAWQTYAEGQKDTWDELVEWYHESMEQIRAEAEMISDVLMNAMTQMSVAMVQAVETGESMFKAMGRAALSVFADMFESLLTFAITEIILEMAKTAGILTLKGFLNPLNWAAIAPAMAAGAAAIASVKMVRSKLKFHEGGKPEREGYYYVKTSEHVFDPHKARRGGYGSTYRDVIPAGGMGALKGVSVNIGEVHIRNEADIDRLARRLGDRVLGELARAT